MSPVRQEGAILMMSLIILIVLTLMGISALDNTRLQTRMAANTKTVNCAFQVANVGLDYVFTEYNDSVGGEELMDFEENKWVEPPPKAPYYRTPVEESTGSQADFRIKRVVTANAGSETNRLYFLVESTGSCQNIDPEHLAILREAWTLEAPTSTEYETSSEKYIDFPTECYDGPNGECPAAIKTMCNKALSSAIANCKDKLQPEINACLNKGSSEEECDAQIEKQCSDSMSEDSEQKVNDCIDRLSTQAGNCDGKDCGVKPTEEEPPSGGTTT